MKICFYSLREFDELEFCKQFEKEYGVEFVYTSDYPNEENIELARGCEAISIIPCDMSEAVLKKFQDVGVKYIECRSIGYDHVDLKAAKKLGMKVSNVSYPPDGVANYAIMLMMACSRHFGHILKRVELQDYSLKNKIGKDISTSTVGIMGTGKIGSTVIRHLSGFGCRILAYDAYQNDEVKKYAEYVSMDKMLAECDIISLHMNANEENYHVIDKEAIEKMKDGAIIVNTARGKLIDSKALIAGLESGKLGGAALDVLENEDGLYFHNRVGEVISNHDMAILRSFPNVIISPHTAFYTMEDVEDMVKGCFESIYAFENGKETVHEVTYKE